MAYGTNAPYGLKPIRTISGSNWNSQLNTYQISNDANAFTTSLYSGDPVALATATVSQAPYNGTATALVGVFIGAIYTDTNGTVQFQAYVLNGISFLANTTPTAYVVDDPHVIFQVQGDNAGVVATGIGQNVNLGNSAQNAGNSNLGQSTFTLTTAGIGNPGTTATLSVKILRLAGTVTQNLSLPYYEFEVLINNHMYSAGTPGIV